jgi:hypothetical protein
LGCTCSESNPGQGVLDNPPLDTNCPVHGLAPSAREHTDDAEPIDTEGDIVDAAIEPELRGS